MFIFSWIFANPKTTLSIFVGLLLIGGLIFAVHHWDQVALIQAQADAKQAASDRDTAIKTAGDNHVLLQQEYARENTTATVLADQAQATSERGDTLAAIHTEIERAPATPVSCPAVPARFRAIASVLRQREAANANPGSGGTQTGNPGGGKGVPTITINAR